MFQAVAMMERRKGGRDGGGGGEHKTKDDKKFWRSTRANNATFDIELDEEIELASIVVSGRNSDSDNHSVLAPRGGLFMLDLRRRVRKKRSDVSHQALLPVQCQP